MSEPLRTPRTSNAILRAALLLASLGLLGLGAPGCALFHYGYTDPVYEVPEEHDVLIIPFADLTENERHFQSVRGAGIAEAAIAHLEAEADELRLVPISEIYTLFDQTDPTRLDPHEAAERLGAEVFVVGQIVDFRTRNPGMMNMLRGSATLAIEIFQRSEEGDSHRRVWYGEVEGSFPDDFGNDFGEAFADEDQIVIGLMAVLGKKVGRLFYEHDPDPLPKSSFDR